MTQQPTASKMEICIVLSSGKDFLKAEFYLQLVLLRRASTQLSIKHVHKIGTLWLSRCNRKSVLRNIDITLK
jgi:hypothetical protein